MESKGTLDGGNSLAHRERPPNSGESGEQEASGVVRERGSMQRGVQLGEGVLRG